MTRTDDPIAEYQVTAARPGDAALLPAVELAAAQLLAAYAPASVLGGTISQEAQANAQLRGQLWVALKGDSPVGFAHVNLIEPRAAHLEELDVHPEHGRRGLGTRLVLSVCEWAAEEGFQTVTLTTSRDAPWNMPFYARLGFEAIAPERLTPALRAKLHEEVRRGYDPASRVAMQRACQVGNYCETITRAEGR